MGQGQRSTLAGVRFWQWFDRRSGDCWLWNGAKSNGYGRFWWNGKLGMAHRFSFISHHGSIPDGLQVDHLCRNRACVNPDHLELVTPKMNVHRSPLTSAGKTHCKWGHPFNVENTHYLARGERVCKTCSREREDRFRKRSVG